MVRLHDYYVSVAQLSPILPQPTWNYLSNAHTSYQPFTREVAESELQQSNSPNVEAGHAVPSVALVKKTFLGKYAISAEEFSEEMVSNTPSVHFL